MNLYGLIAPDLVIIDALGNSRNNGVPLATAMADLQTLITAAKAAGADVLMVSSMPSDPSIIDAATQTAWSAATLKLAIDNDCMIDNWYSRHGDYAAWNALGMMFDTRHGTNLCYADYGDHLASFIAAV